VATSRALQLLHPKWLPLHLFTVAACVAMVLLGRWQLRVAHQHHGDIRYYAYAFQWWAFTAFALAMWGRIMLDYLHRPAAESAGSATDPSRPGQPTGPDPSPGYLAYRPPTVPAADPDPERARFNAYLAELNAKSLAESKLQKPSNAGAKGDE
jgi:hypothetical protein